MENTIIQLAELIAELRADNNELRESLNNSLHELVRMKEAEIRHDLQAELQSRYEKLFEAAAAFFDNTDTNQSIPLLDNLTNAVNALR